MVTEEQGVPYDEEEEEDDDEKVDNIGCCYEHGFGAMHKPCCFSNHRSSAKEGCESKKRMGGATKFDPRECSVVKLEQGVESTPEPTLLQKLLPGILPVNLDMLRTDRTEFDP